MAGFPFRHLDEKRRRFVKDLTKIPALRRFALTAGAKATIIKIVGGW